MSADANGLVDRGAELARSGRYAAHGLSGTDDPGPEPPPDGESAGNFDTAVEYRMSRLRVDREARRRLDEEQRPKLELPPVKPLTALLDEPDEATPWLVDRVMQVGSRVMLAAQFKTGKTTLVGNLIRAMSDGTPFLGTFEVRRRPNSIVLIDDELSERMLRRWLRDQNIDNTAAVSDVVSLRGRLGTFNLLDEPTRAEWAARLRGLGCDFLIVDCLRPILDALGLDENHEAGKFLTPFDALLAEAGITSAVMVDHMGHNAERNRGDSRKLDWPDATWKLVRENEQPDSPRFFSAYGRDVDVFEGRLAFDPANRRLTYAAGSRGDAKTEAALAAVVELLAADARSGGGGLSGRGITDLIGAEHTQKAIRAASKLAVERGLVVTEPGDRGAKLHRIAEPCTQCGGPLTAGQTGRHKSCTGPEAVVA